MGKRCICEICTCGRHRCPHRPWAPGGEFGPCMLTSYNTSYKQHPINLRESCKPQQSALRSDEPLADKTTFRTDYIKHPLERPYVKPPDVYQKPAGEMDGLTSYNKDYTEKHAPPAQAIKHDGQRQLPCRFEGEPTYKADFRKWPMTRPEAKAPEAWMPPQVAFEGQSTFQRDFRKYNEPPRKSLKPSEAARMSDAPFDGLTGYRDDYIKHPLQPRMAKEKQCYKAPNVPFEGLSTFMKDYTAKQGGKVDSCKPDAEAFQSDAPFDDMTTFKNDFRKWPGERPYVHQPETWQKPDGEIDLNTTNRINFKEHPLQKIKAVKPGEGRVMNPGQFEGLTNYKADYKPWGIRREMPRPPEAWQPNTIKFDGCPTYKAHYIKHNAALTKSMKPDTTALASDAPFDDATMYRTEYTKKKADICPAAILDTKATTYTYVETDARGHKQYKQMWEQVTPLRRVSSAKMPQAAVA